MAAATAPTQHVQVEVQGNNNCQFHALADQLKRHPPHHIDALMLRIECIDWLHDNGDMYMEAVESRATCTHKFKSRGFEITKDAI